VLGSRPARCKAVPAPGASADNPSIRGSAALPGELTVCAFPYFPSPFLPLLAGVIALSRGLSVIAKGFLSKRRSQPFAIMNPLALAHTRMSHRPPQAHRPRIWPPFRARPGFRDAAGGDRDSKVHPDAPGQGITGRIRGYRETSVHHRPPSAPRSPKVSPLTRPAGRQMALVVTAWPVRARPAVAGAGSEPDHRLDDQATRPARVSGSGPRPSRGLRSARSAGGGRRGPGGKTDTAAGPGMPCPLTSVADPAYPADPVPRAAR
jgi:hypothetical protein